MEIDKNKIISDLKEAKQIADNAASGYNRFDGPDNFNSCCIRIPKIRSERVLGWIGSAGLNAYKTTWLGPGYMITPDYIRVQRTVFVESFVKSMKEKGYDIMPYYQLD